MKWRDLLSIDLISLVTRGKIVLMPPRRERLKKKRGHKAVEPWHPPMEWRGPNYYRKQQWFSHLSLISSVLASIVQLNAPLVSGLAAAARDCQKRSVSALLWALHDRISSGLSLSDAMASLPNFFPPFYVDLVRAGESSGQLHRHLLNLSDRIIKRMLFGTRIRQYLLYLGATFVVLLSIPLFICTYIMPVFIEILKDFGMSAPSSATSLMAFGEKFGYLRKFLEVAGDILRPQHIRDEYVMLLVFLAICVVVVFVLIILPRLPRWIGSLRSPAWLGRLMIRIPFLGRAIAKTNIASASLILEGLLDAGFPLDEALEKTASADISRVYRNMFSRMGERMHTGVSFSEAVNEHRWIFPRSYHALLAVAENAGRVPETLRRLSDQYFADAEKTKRLILDLVTPFGVLLLGAGVLWTTVAVFQSYTGIADAILGGM